MSDTRTPTKVVLHVGCGGSHVSEEDFPLGEWDEIRVDADPEMEPDVVCDFRDLSGFEDEAFDAVYCSHALEHLHFFEVAPTLQGFNRVLCHGGKLLVTVPDLQGACEAVAEGRLEEMLYESPSGPIAALDVIFGWRPVTYKFGELWLHRCGFTRDTLGGFLGGAGFAGEVKRYYDDYELRAEAIKP